MNANSIAHWIAYVDLGLFVVLVVHLLVGCLDIGHFFKATYTLKMPALMLLAFIGPTAWALLYLTGHIS